MEAFKEHQTRMAGSHEKLKMPIFSESAKEWMFVPFSKSVWDAQLPREFLKATQMDKTGLKAELVKKVAFYLFKTCLLYTSPSPRDNTGSRMPSSA